MAVRQYIGARYVPRFMGTLDPTQQYEALDVVDNGLGTSYIAKKIVPPGTPLTDADFWTIYGASSGAVLDLQNRMDAAENDIDGLETDTAQLKEDRELLPEYRHYLFMSDSYDVHLDYCRLIANQIKCASRVIKSQSGAGFFKFNSPFMDRTFYNIITNLDPLTDAEKAKITDVCFCVAVGNDNPQTSSDLTGAMTQMDTWLHANLPKLQKIHLLGVGWTLIQTNQNRIRQNLAIYSDQAAVLNWHYADCTRVMRTGCYIDPTDADKYHPTSEAGPLIADACASAIQNGACQWSRIYPHLTVHYNMTLPAAWSGASITVPSDGTLDFSLSVDSNGNISYTELSAPISIDGVSVAPGTTVYNIQLTPTDTNKDFIPTGLRQPMIVYDATGQKAFDSAMLIKTADNTIYLRVLAYTDTAINNANLRIFSYNSLIVPC